MSAFRVDRDKHMKCLKCDHDWWSYNAVTNCPECNHLYVKWLNYEDFSNAYEEWLHLTENEEPQIIVLEESILKDAVWHEDM